jgi:hypothetical protein
MRAVVAGSCVALLLAACASYDGRNLVAGSSTGAQVESAMGQPALRVANPDGSSTLYYPKSPLGRHTYAVTVGADGKVRSIDQRLTLANIGKLAVGKSSRKEVQELLGPPDRHNVTRLALTSREVWEYPFLDYQEKRVLWVQFSEDGILREVVNSRDDWNESPGAGMP